MSKFMTQKSLGSKTNEEKKASIIGKIVGFILGIVFVTIVFGSMILARGFTIKILWGWFIVPLFNLPELNIAYALGLSIIIAALTHKVMSGKDERSDWEKILNPFKINGFYLLVGWIITWFM